MEVPFLKLDITLAWVSAMVNMAVPMAFSSGCRAPMRSAEVRGVAAAVRPEQRNYGNISRIFFVSEGFKDSLWQR
jgi:hypothetical protein